MADHKRLQRRIRRRRRRRRGDADELLPMDIGPVAHKQGKKLTPDVVQMLQATHGNHYVNHLLQCEADADDNDAANDQEPGNEADLQGRILKVLGATLGKLGYAAAPGAAVEGQLNLFVQMDHSFIGQEGSTLLQALDSALRDQFDDASGLKLAENVTGYSLTGRIGDFTVNILRQPLVPYIEKDNEPTPVTELAPLLSLAQQLAETNDGMERQSIFHELLHTLSMDGRNGEDDVKALRFMDLLGEENEEQLKQQTEKLRTEGFDLQMLEEQLKDVEMLRNLYDIVQTLATDQIGELEYLLHERGQEHLLALLPELLDTLRRYTEDPLAPVEDL